MRRLWPTPRNLHFNGWLLALAGFGGIIFSLFSAIASPSWVDTDKLLLTIIFGMSVLMGTVAFQIAQNETAVHTETRATRDAVADVSAAVAQVAGAVNRLPALVGLAEIKTLNMNQEAPDEWLLRTEQARHTIWDMNLSQERPDGGAPEQDGYRAARNRRVLNREITFQRVEVFYNWQHLEHAVRRMAMFEGYPFYIKHYRAPRKMIPILHLMAFDEEHIYLGGFYHGKYGVPERAIYIQSKEASVLFNQYLLALWQDENSIALNGPDGIYVEQVKDAYNSLPRKPGSYETFDVWYARLQREGRQWRQQLLNQPHQQAGVLA